MWRVKRRRPASYQARIRWIYGRGKASESTVRLLELPPVSVAWARLCIDIAAKLLMTVAIQMMKDLLNSPESLAKN